MKVSELIEQLKEIIKDVGDREITNIKMDLEDDVSYYSNISMKAEVKIETEDAKHNTEIDKS